MSWKGFSISAPRLSLEEVQDEVNALTAEETLKLNLDVHGQKMTANREESPLSPLPLRADSGIGSLATESSTQEEEEEEGNEDDLEGDDGDNDNDQLVVPDQDALLNELQLELSQIPSDESVEYLRALECCPDEVNDPEFRFMFLQCEEFNAKTAARRMVTYWKSKVELFGNERAFHQITTKDLIALGGEEALKMGGARVLPEKDAFGRGILVVDRKYFDQRVSSRIHMIRLIWYMHHVALEDPEIRTNGLIYVAGHPRRPTTLQEQDRKLDSIILRHVRTAIPVRIVAVHHSFSSRLLEFVVPVMMVLFGPMIRHRYVPHKGREEITFLRELNDYGISRDILPRNMGGTHDYDYTKWLEKRQELQL